MIRDTAAQDRPLTAAPRPLRRGLLIAAVAVPVLAATAWMVRGHGVAQASVSQSRLVVAEVERGPFVRDVAAEGKVVAAGSPTLHAPAAGTATLKVLAGDTVRQGQVLAVVDSPALMNRLAQEMAHAETLAADHQRAQIDARQQRAALQGALEASRIDHLTARNDLDRKRKAHAAGAVAGMQVEQASDLLEKTRIALEQAEAGLRLKGDSVQFDVQARAHALERQRLLVRELQRQVEALNVRSPVDGQVGQLFIAERARVAEDAPLLSVVDLSSLEVQMQVAESFARDLAVGMPGEIGAAGRTWPAVVSAISPEVVNNEVAARLRFVGEPPGQLRQNQRLSVRVLLDRRDDVLAVRRGNFVEASGGAHAYVLRDGVAVRVPVKLGARGLDKVEILHGLAVGDQVVVSGSEQFNHAEQVAISR